MSEAMDLLNLRERSRLGAGVSYAGASYGDSGSEQVLSL